MTRDEAIAVVRQALRDADSDISEHGEAEIRGARLALEALAAAGVFADDEDYWCDCAPNCGHVRPGRTMADKLDAAGIK